MRFSKALSSCYDIVIAGGGMVGSAMACSICASSALNAKSVLLIESNKVKPKDKLLMSESNVYSNRVSAISPASMKIFEKIGIWEYLSSVATPKVVKQLRVWDSCSQSKINFEYSNFDRDVAYIIENSKIIDACFNALQSGETSKRHNIEFKYESKIAELELPVDAQESVRIVLADGSTLTTSLLIGADGANSFVRSKMGSHYVSWSYDQRAIVATLDINTVGENAVAWQRFTPTGPVALLPLTENKSSLVWTTTSQEAERLMQLPDDQFVDELNKILWEEDYQNDVTNGVLSWFDSIVQTISPSATKVEQLPPTVVNIQASSRACYPLGFGHSTNYVRARSALIGDAAHRIHPLAGQGVNLGFGDCKALTNVLEEAVENGADIGSILYLKDYESRRQLKNLPVMLTMDALNRLYGTTFTPIVLARSIGLNATNYAGFLKDAIMDQASNH